MGKVNDTLPAKAFGHFCTGTSVKVYLDMRHSLNLDAHLKTEVNFQINLIIMTA